MGDRISKADRKRVEAAIASKVPRPSRAQYKALARKAAEHWGWDRITDNQRAALKDEAKRWRGVQGKSTLAARLGLAH